MDKYDVISGIITQVDKLADARGVEKCTLVVSIIQQLSALAKGLGDEDKAHKAEKKLLEDQLKPAPLEEGETREGGRTVTFDLEDLERVTEGKEADHGADDDAD